jgi:Sterol desaturase
MPDRSSPASRVRLFKSDRLEKLTFVSPIAFAVTWALLLPAIAWVGWGHASLSQGIALYLGGLVIWTLFEYVMHRYLFHWKTDWKLGAWVVHVFHGNHHESPNDPYRNLMPPGGSLPIAAAVWALFVALVGPAGTWGFLGFIMGYVAYDITHFACHQWPMRSRIGMMLKRHHMRHHYWDEDTNFAITAIFWDKVFGTRVGVGKERAASLPD